MNYIIKNDVIEVEISSFGAELQSIKKDGTEYLWQGDINSWKNRATNIFPYIGRLKEGKYIFENKLYEMGSHGFARNTDFSCEKTSYNEIIFKMESSEDTLKQFPFKFDFLIKYIVKDNTLDIVYQVNNKGDNTMYFGLGGHPGFIVPLEEGLKFDDYFLEFSDVCNPINHLVSDSGLITNCVEYPLYQGKFLNLKHSLFDNDALIFENMDKKLKIKSSKKGTREIEVYYPNMKYLGIWHSPKKEVNFVCIEPWTSLPSREDRTEDFKTQENLISLKAKEEYTNKWSITIS